ncbi:MAG TPA: hypothetical protein ENH85_01980 [Candidatus Scalindua sp.]|nr:hypothetical protein [Candidatus Scalindua sp.]
MEWIFIVAAFLCGCFVGYMAKAVKPTPLSDASISFSVGQLVHIEKKRNELLGDIHGQIGKSTVALIGAINNK